MIGIQVLRTTGLAELERNLRQFSLKMQRTMVKKAMREGAKPIQAAARQRAPVGQKTYTYGGRKVRNLRKIGQLKRGITVRSGRGRPGAEVLVKIGPNRNAFYGLFIEGGWTPTGPTGKLRKRSYVTRRDARSHRQQGRAKIPGRPFMEPASRQAMKAAVDAVALSLRRQMGEFV